MIMIAGVSARWRREESRFHRGMPTYSVHRGCKNHLKHNKLQTPPHPLPWGEEMRTSFLLAVRTQRLYFAKQEGQYDRNYTFSFFFMNRISRAHNANRVTITIVCRTGLSIL